VNRNLYRPWLDLDKCDRDIEGGEGGAQRVDSKRGDRGDRD
jgi:hypothetical protein